MSSTNANDGGDGDASTPGGGTPPPPPQSEESSSNSSDPSGFLLPQPSLVTVVNTARDDVNNRVGTPTSYDTGRGRYTVKMEDERGGVLSLKPANLRRANQVEKARHQARKLRGRVQRVLADPNLRRQVSQLYAQLQRRLPPYLPPERLALVLLVLLAVSIRLLGFSKTLVLLTTSTLPLVVSLPDLTAGSDVKTCARNFPRNLRNAVAESTGYHGVSERVALAGFVVLLAMSGKLLVTPTTTRVVAPPSSPPVAPVGGGPATSSSGLDLDGMYRLGYDDGVAGREYGSSLPEESSSPLSSSSSSGGASSRTLGASDDLDWRYDPPPPPPPKRGGLFGGGKFGIGTVLSLVHLVRMGRELATGPDGRLDANLLVANVRLLEPWKMGLLCLSLYKVVTAFL